MTLLNCFTYESSLLAGLNKDGSPLFHLISAGAPLLKLKYPFTNGHIYAYKLMIVISCKVSWYLGSFKNGPLLGNIRIEEQL
jgi:hypothetical protein